ncbi:methylamine utilization protein [Pseudomonas sp. HK3]
MYWRIVPALLYLLPTLAYSQTGLAKAYQVHFVDDDNQPIQYVVIAHPTTAVNKSASSQKNAVIDQINMQFSPMVIAVEQGQSVNFPNSDNIRHHVYSFSKAKRFETKLYANKPEAPVVFNQPGLVVLGCNIHDSMVGYIFVSPWQDFGVSNIHGVANINAPEPPKKLEYWHPWSLTPNQVNTYQIKEWPQTGPLLIQLMLNKPASTPVFKTFKRGFGSP